MNNTTQQIVNKAWKFAHVLRDDGLSCYITEGHFTDADVNDLIQEQPHVH